MALNPQLVLDAAIRHLDEVGLDAFSVRRVADGLGVRIGALYWHYKNRQALVDAIAARILEPLTLMEPSTDAWDVRLCRFARAYRQALLSHTDGARVITAISGPGPMGHAFMAIPVKVLCEAGLPATDAAAAADVLTSYVNGFTIEEQNRKLGQPEQDRDRGFEFGLTLLLDGLRSRTTA
ncbi:TetR family transcriptional regulator BioQ [Actinoallomurus oryzae]|uniref:TetR family transcriptional regulator BioQ n=1 Tax=Actinoallomurus oryzae TaxID=502180 RepID=A0ABP8QPQ6_9ACTN